MITHRLILGGARSGKSRRALALAEAHGARPVYIATAEPVDDEMQIRIDAHRLERGDPWLTVEEPLALGPAVREQATSNRICVVDCLTVWLGNLMHYERDWSGAVEDLCDALASAEGPAILVSNEIGLGIVPETRLGRQFRDAQGYLNQTLAQHCTDVEFIAAGLPLVLKGGAPLVSAPTAP